ncbi:MAG: hypothetical protein IKW83_02255 [Muribaculaceae bacterium]|nr:hypothetical protein [Muribaculaceae bacterium]
MFKIFRIFFGIFMILLYFGVAYLLFINFFKWNVEPWLSLRYVIATVLAIYGIYRCYRQIKGTDYYLLRDMEERFNKYNNTQDNHEN